MSDLKIDSATFCSASTLNYPLTIVVDTQLISGALAETHQSYQVASVDEFDHGDGGGEIPVLLHFEGVETKHFEASVCA